MRKFFAAAAIAALAIAGAANATFVVGAPVSVNGQAFPEFGGTQWGTASGQGTHALGGFSTYTDVFFPAFFVTVSSTVGGPNSLSVTVDYSAFAPGDFTTHLFEILGLKTDGTISGVTATQGTASVLAGGNGVTWTGSGAQLAANPFVTLNITQVPAPGALALLGVAGLASRRRRA